MQAATNNVQCVGFAKRAPLKPGAYTRESCTEDAKTNVCVKGSSRANFNQGLWEMTFFGA